jgi:hypothetical protein
MSARRCGGSYRERTVSIVARAQDEGEQNAHADEDKLRTDVSVDDTSDHNGWERNTVRNSPEGMTGVAQSRGDCVCAGKCIDDNPHNQVERRVGNLEGIESLGEIVGFLHLCYEGEGFGERQMSCNLDRGLVPNDTNSNHRDQDSTCTEDCYQTLDLNSHRQYVLKMEMNEATLKYEIPLSVRGIVSTKQMTADTTAQTTEHDAPSVIVSNAISPVRTCEPQTKTMKMTWAAPRISRPIGPARM